MAHNLHKLNKVCVAVKFDESSRQAIKIAEQICVRTGASMHLVHVCENMLVANFGSLASAVPLPADVLHATQQSLEEIAESKIRELARTVAKSVEVSTSVAAGTLGKPAEFIEVDALAHRCSLIIVGTAPANHRFVPRGFSCALSLMSHSRLPVMAVNSSQKIDLSGERLEMIISDDLKDGSLPAIESACRLAFDLTKTNIHHIHINGVTVETLEAALNTAISSSHSRPNPGVSATEVYEFLMAKLLKSLERRTTNLNATSELVACNYKVDIFTANSVTDALEDFAAKVKPNIIAFGRHHRLHQKPFGLGQMPNYAMLNLQYPVLVFPVDEV